MYKNAKAHRKNGEEKSNDKSITKKIEGTNQLPHGTTARNQFLSIGSDSFN